MFLLIKKTFIGLLTGILSVNNHANCVSLNKQKCRTQPTIINLHRNEYIQGLHYYQFMVNLYNVSEIVKLLMAYLIKHLFQTKQKI